MSAGDAGGGLRRSPSMKLRRSPSMKLHKAAQGLGHPMGAPGPGGTTWRVMLLYVVVFTSGCAMTAYLLSLSTGGAGYDARSASASRLSALVGSKADAAGSRRGLALSGAPGE